MANTIVYDEDWAVKAQARLDAPQNWKEICNVEITNGRVLHNPYFTDATVQTTARNAAYTHQDITLTDESVTISGVAILPQKIDRGDLAQTTYVKQMDLADSQATLLNEYLETQMLAAHAQWTDFDNASIGGAAGNITVSISNIDDIVRNILRVVRTANGQTLLDRNGAFIVWRPADFEKLEAFMQANGFNMADAALKNGGEIGVKYMGVYHYVSTKHTAGHLFAGVRKLFHLGIVKDTYGQVVVDEEPATSTGAMSAIAVIMRLDFQFKAWTKTAPLLLDVLVA